MSAFYNENDPYAAHWLENLIQAGHIAPGAVNAKSILDLEGRELAGFRQAHFFAGVGVWSSALRAAGWPDSRSVWTGSCPCQPFSGAGRGHGFNDKRHLWPAWFWLIEQHRPDVLFGEQVEGPAGRAWLDLVFTDLEGLSYSCGAIVFPAAGVGAPHGRHRTFWVADARRERWQHLRHNLGAATRGSQNQIQQWQRLRPDDRSSGDASRLADADQRQCGWLTGAQERQSNRQAGKRIESDGGAADDRGVGGLADTTSQRQHSDKSGRDSRKTVELAGAEPRRDGRDNGATGWAGPVNGFWRDPDWIFCRDNKWRPIEPGSFPLAHGAFSRVGRLRAYGNAIVLQQAQAFIEAFLELEALSL